MKALIMLLLVGVIIFSMVSFFSGTKFGDIIGGVSSVGEKITSVVDSVDWRGAVQKGNVMEEELLREIEKYNNGEVDSPEAIKEKIEVFLVQIDKLNEIKKNLEGDEKDEMKDAIEKLEDDWDDIIDKYKIVEDIVEEETSGETGTKDHFFGGE